MDRKLKYFFQKIFSFFLNSISFNTPKAIVFNISIILIVLFLAPTTVIIHSPFKCIFKNIIFPFIFRGVCPTKGFFANCDCPGCGLTRGISNLLHGNIEKAIEFNILSIPVFLIMISILTINLIKIYKNK